MTLCRMERIASRRRADPRPAPRVLRTTTWRASSWVALAACCPCPPGRGTPRAASCPCHPESVELGEKCRKLSIFKDRNDEFTHSFAGPSITQVSCLRGHDDRHHPADLEFEPGP